MTKHIERPDLAKLDEKGVAEFALKVSDHAMDASENVGFYLRGGDEMGVAPILVNVQKDDKEPAIFAIDEIKALFGPAGKHWCKQNYATVQDGISKFCLSGAASV